MPLEIRRAVRGDYAAVRVLEELEFGVHRRARPDYFEPLENSYPEEEFEELLADPCPICWVAVQDGTVVGLCFGKIGKTTGNPGFNAGAVRLYEKMGMRVQYYRMEEDLPANSNL